MKLMTYFLFGIIAFFSINALAQTPNNNNTFSINVKHTSDSTSITSKQNKDASSVQISSTKDASGNPVFVTKTSDTTVKITETKSSTPVEVVIIKKIMPDYKVPQQTFRLSPKGPNSITGSIGIKSGITDNATGGFMPSVGYAYQLSRILWFDSNFSMNFGGDCSKNSTLDGYACGGLNGFGITLLGGLLWRFLDQPAWTIPLNPYVRVLTGISFIISNGPNDGFALVVKTAGGARYSFTEDFAVGAEMGLTVGPSFRNELSMGAFASVDFVVSVEYSF